MSPYLLAETAVTVGQYKSYLMSSAAGDTKKLLKRAVQIFVEELFRSPEEKVGDFAGGWFLTVTQEQAFCQYYGGDVATREQYVAAMYGTTDATSNALIYDFWCSGPFRCAWPQDSKE